MAFSLPLAWWTCFFVLSLVVDQVSRHYHFHYLLMTCMSGNAFYWKVNCLQFRYFSSLYPHQNLNTYLGGKQLSKPIKWLCPLFPDHVPSIRRQAGPVAWHAHQHTVCHQGFASVKAFPGAVPGHHLCLRLSRNVQTGTTTNGKLPWLNALISFILTLFSFIFFS